MKTEVDYEKAKQPSNSSDFENRKHSLNIKLACEYVSAYRNEEIHLGLIQGSQKNTGSTEMPAENIMGNS